MTTKLVLRVLDAQGQLLGWTAVDAEARGDGTLRATRPVSVLMDAAGTPDTVSIHWADVNVEVRVPCQGGQPLAPGVWLVLHEYEREPMIRLGTPAGGLPPVTVKQSVAIGVPVSVVAASSGTGHVTATQ